MPRIWSFGINPLNSESTHGKGFRFSSLIRMFPVLLFLVLVPSPGYARITIEKVTERFDPKTNTYTYTVVLNNTGRLVVDYYLTAQPYNDKSLDTNGKPIDAANRQVRKINIGGEQRSTYTFTFVGAEGKDWKWKYTDLRR